MGTGYPSGNFRRVYVLGPMFAYMGVGLIFGGLVESPYAFIFGAALLTLGQLFAYKTRRRY